MHLDHNFDDKLIRFIQAGIRAARATARYGDAQESYRILSDITHLPTILRRGSRWRRLLSDVEQDVLPRYTGSEFEGTEIRAVACAFKDAIAKGPIPDESARPNISAKTLLLSKEPRSCLTPSKKS